MIKSPNAIQGAGIGLRACHYAYILENQPTVPWFEVLSDNYLAAGAPLSYLDAICEIYPVVLHGVGLSLGSTDPLHEDYLSRLKTLINRVNPAWVSDHLCWTSVEGHHFHDLLPLPHTHESIQHVAERILQVQDQLGQRILIENLSSYLQYKHDEMTEWEFISAVAKKADCYLLLDVNNVYVSSVNHGFDPVRYIDSLPSDRIKQFHLAGYADKGRYLLDNHGDCVHQPVWDLYAFALEKLGSIPTLIEWDENIPAFPVLQAEAAKAQSLMHRLIEA